MTTEVNPHLESVMYSYTTSAHYLETENKILKETITQLQSELKKFHEPALMVCDIVEVLDNRAIIRTPNGNKFYVGITHGCEKLVPGDSILAEQKNLMIVKKIVSNKRFPVERFVIIDNPKLKWESVGGLDEQIEEIKEVIELPLKKPELFKKIGIQPPKGILLNGLPGCGKTLLAKAVASSTQATFIEIVASELVQKFIGEGAKLVKEIFQLARERAPSIVYIDELDALAAKRIDVGTSGEREVHRTFMQLLAELDGFKHLGNVKVIGCTNRKDILDPAILRPGRLDRILYVPMPNKEGVAQIFSIHRHGMSLEKDLDTQQLVEKMVGCSGAEIRSICTEAGYYAIRENRDKVRHVDFLHAIEKVKQKEELDKDVLEMYG